MKKRTRLAGLAVAIALSLLLVACHGGQDVSIDGRSITLHASGAPTATITSQGSLSVGSKLVDTSPDERQLLVRYYDDVVAIHKGAENMEKAGVAIAGKALHLAGHSIGKSVGLASGSSAADQARAQAVENAGQEIGRKGKHLCDKVHQAETLQSTLARRIPAFQPYARLDPAPGVQCDGGVTVL